MSFWCHHFDQKSNKDILRISALKVFIVWFKKTDKKWPKQLGRFEGKKSLFFYQAKKLLILCLFCKIGKINIILPSKKSSWIYWVLFAELKKWILLLFYQLLQKNGFIILLSKKKLLSLQTWKKMWLKTEVKVDFNIDGTKYF